MMSPSQNSNSMDGFNTMTFRASSMSATQQSNSSSSMPQQPMQQQQQQQQIIVATNPSSSSSSSNYGASMASTGQPMGVPLDPLFVAPPPKTHKALHSDVRDSNRLGCFPVNQFSFDLSVDSVCRCTVLPMYCVSKFFYNIS